MKRSFLLCSLAVCAAFLLSSCGSSKKAVESSVPEEAGLNLQKLSDESKNAVIGHSTQVNFRDFLSTAYGGNTKKRFNWSTMRLLSVSPDGSNLAYLSLMNKQSNVMIRRTTSTGVSTQRTFRDVSDFCWGSDNNIYFSDYVGNNDWLLESVPALSGTLMRQLTSNNHDINPALSKDGQILYFVRFDNSGPFVWMLDFETNTLTSCAKGYNPYPIGEGREAFVCTRNSAEGRSEIWLVNYINGQETLLLSDKERGYSNPCVSPDGQWLVVQGNAVSSANKKQNLDIFAVKMDGSHFMQLTYHPNTDCCPVWSADGKAIYFISSRGTRDGAFNIWKISFPY